MNGIAAGIAGYTIHSGDRLLMTTKQTLPTYGGLVIFFTNGNATGALTDIATGTPFFDDGQSDGAWHALVGDLTPYANLTISYVLAGIHSQTPAGTFDLYFNDVAIQTAAGLTLPILTGQSATVTNFSGTQCGAHSMTSGTVSTPVSFPANTSFYVADRLNTTEIELAGGGWPTALWQFDPFGQQIVGNQFLIPGNSDGTTMPFKFTGKERDTESGLDYFGARYYGSNMGRFMTPDWSSETDPVPYADLSNPQSLNLYSYVHNNPLRVADPDGHDGDDDEGDGDPQQAGAIPLAAPITTPSVAEAVIGAIAAAPEAVGAALVFGPAMAFPKSLDCGCLTPAQQAAYAAMSKADDEHTKNARPSTQEKHEKGRSRRKQDRGGEKGDKNRRPQRKPPIGPNGKKIPGPWPRRNNMFVPLPEEQKDNSTVTTTQQDHLPPAPKPQEPQN